MGIPHHRSNETVVDGHRDADVHAVVSADVIATPPRVALGMAGQRKRRRLDNDVVEGDARAKLELVELLAQLGCPGHVDIGREEEVRHRPQGLDQPARDRLAYLRERDVHEILARDVRPGRGSRRRPGGQRGLDVPLDDSAPGPGPYDRLQAEPGLPGQAAGEG